MRVMLRDTEGLPYEAELVCMVELRGLGDYKLAVTVPNEGLFTVTELSTGLAMGCGLNERSALKDARMQLREHGGNAAFRAKVDSRLAEFGPLPPIGDAA